MVVGSWLVVVGGMEGIGMVRWRGDDGGEMVGNWDGDEFIGNERFTL